jgi:hypothetical protein
MNHYVQYVMEPSEEEGKALESSGSDSGPARPLSRCCSVHHFSPRTPPAGKPNFNFQKRQKELAKQKQSEANRQRKLEKMQ